MQLNFSAPKHVKAALISTMKTQKSPSMSRHILWCVEVGLRFAGKPPYTHEQLMQVPEVNHRALLKSTFKNLGVRKRVLKRR